MGQNATTIDPIYGSPHIGRRHSMSPFSVSGRYRSTLDVARRRSMKNCRNTASALDLDQISTGSSTGYRLELALSAMINSDSSEQNHHRRKPRESMLEGPQLLNVNTASEEQLMTLPGVDRAAARAIVQRRHLVGPFEELNDLVAVPGVGKKKLKRIRSEISTTSSRDAGEPPAAADCCRDSGDSSVFASRSPPPPQSGEITLADEP